PAETGLALTSLGTLALGDLRLAWEGTLPALYGR
ncbi:MAG: hypothetical protein QOG76_1858, partial [Pseudonocardiales bacterium]|nr:hypothetical protein [Pseudonocardiales bacterium]